MMKKKISNVISLLFIVILIALCILIYLPKVFGMSVFYVETDSMLPTLRPGYLIVTKKVAFENIKSGDIITFSDLKQTSFCTHRVVSKNSDDLSIKTKGDNNDFYDPLDTSFDFVKGKVVFALPFAGNIVRVLNTKTLRLIACAAAVIWIAFEMEFKKIKKGRSER